MRLKLWGRFGRGPETVGDNDVRLVDECLAAIGNMAKLEALQLSDLPLHGKGLACLAGLKELKSLDVNFWHGEWNGSAAAIERVVLAGSSQLL